MKIVFVASRIDRIVIGLSLLLAVTGIVIGSTLSPFLGALILMVVCIGYLAYAIVKHLKLSRNWD